MNFKVKNKVVEITTNEFINLADVRGSFLYTKDNLIWQFLKVQPISTALMTVDEKRMLTDVLSREISPINIPFKILFLTRPTDVRQIVDYYEDIKATTLDQKKKESVTATIRYFSQMATSGQVLERQTFISIWTTDKNQKEDELALKTNEFLNALQNSRVTCKLCDETDIINMLGLYYNPLFNVATPVDKTPNYTFMGGQNG